MTISETVIAIASVGLATVYLFGLPRSVGLARVAVKAGSVLLLALAAVLSGAPHLLVLALVLSALGDAFLVYPGKPAFLCGLVSFLAAHLVYAALFWPASGLGMLLGEGQGLRLSLAILMGIGGAGVVALVWPGASAASMQGPALVYAGAILLMSITAVASGNPLLIPGALMFYASDTVLALEKFRIPAEAPIRRLSAPFVWVTYYLAQLMFLLAFIL